MNGTLTPQWVRPISNAEKGELHAERFYANAKDRDPKLLDVIEIEFLRERRNGYRPEDCLVNSRKNWEKLGVYPRNRLISAIEEPQDGLWLDGESSSNGRNDKIPASFACNLTSTLKLVQPKELEVWRQTEGQDFGRPRRTIRGQFRLGGNCYIFAITDPVIEREFNDRPEGSTIIIKEPILCLSVSEMFEKQNACYKLIASVI